MSDYEFHEDAAIFPMMTDEEYAHLLADIREHGQREPIYTYQGKIIDGRNRYKACRALGIAPIVREWDGEGSLVSFIVSLNLHRRHLTASQRAAIAVEVMPRLEAEAKERQIKLAGTRPNLSQKIDQGNNGKSAEHAAQIVGTNRQYVSDAKKIKDEAPDLFEQVRSGQTTISDAKRETREREKTARHKTAASRIDGTTKSDRWDVHCGNFTDVSARFEPHSFDVIITDPPYPKEYLSLYGTLAEESVRLLKPGGSLVVMCGQSYLPEILALMVPHLTYQWMSAYLTPGGQSAQLWTRKVNTFWKPILWFVNGTYSGDWKGDVLKSQENDKRFHGWGQSESGMADIVERFSLPGDTILDPFCGAGTTGVVAVEMGRKFTGIDIDPKAIEMTKERLTNATTS